MSTIIGNPATVADDRSPVASEKPNTEFESWPPMNWPDQPVRVDPPSPGDLHKLRALIVAGTLSVAALLIWLLNPLREGDPIVYWGLTSAVLLRAICRLFEWYNYWTISVPPVLKPRRRWTVDILTTACPGEPPGMIVRTLKAMAAIPYPHTNYLCDEGDDPYLKRVCEELGVVHVTRTQKKHAKAGNINNALAQATGQIAVVLDPDHEPAPYLLERTLGYFEDPAIGFVQSVQAYRNQGDSFVARAAAEQSYHFYGPYMMGMHGHGTTQAIGANCVFRRAALDSIGGHAPGLAEDMHTAMRLYSKGWRSIYLPEILTRGLVPSTLAAFYKQQIKWACGVFDLLFIEYPRLFKNFNLRQKLHYLICPIFFLRGFVGLLEMLVPILCLAYGMVAWRATLPEIAVWFVPPIVLGILIHLRVQRWVMEPHERGMHLDGGLLAIATWWVYLVGVVCAVFRIKVPYIPTPKEDKPTDAGDMALPNFIAAGILVAAASIGLYRDSSPPQVFMACLACTNALALFYVSVTAQQVTLQAIRRRLSGPLRILRPFRVLGRAAAGIYHGFLKQIREGWALSTVLALAICAGCVAVILNKQPVDNDGPFALSKEVDVGGFYTGMDLRGLPDAQRLSRIAALEKQLDYHFRIVCFYQGWGDNVALPLATLKQIRRDGAVPLIKWLPTTGAHDGAILKSIGDGDCDAYVKKFADSIRDFGEPVLLCFAPQPDNPLMPWSRRSGNTPADFVAAWRHISGIFDGEGADNVGWVWNPAHIDTADAYYPGDASGGYVDWIGLCMTNNDADGASFAEMYEPVRAKATKYHLPIMLSDLDTVDGNSPVWLGSAMSDIGSRYPEIKGVLFRDRGVPATTAIGSNIGWTADSESVSYVRQRLKISPFSGGQARPPLAGQPLWFDLQRVTHHDSTCVRGTPGNYTLMVDGYPFYVKGIAYNPGHDWRDADVPLSRRELDQDFTLIRQMGGNTIRRYGQTWSDRNIFNVAAEHQLKVLYGFWFAQNVDYL
ncbi:MAG TPA: glycosyltransferase, partial [Tepidisphaeraceae bacterium]|nr:glycosyltransferase [Tepidisphaeraceae bacterium]